MVEGQIKEELCQDKLQCLEADMIKNIFKNTFFQIKKIECNFAYALAI